MQRKARARPPRCLTSGSAPKRRTSWNAASRSAPSPAERPLTPARPACPRHGFRRPPRWAAGARDVWPAGQRHAGHRAAVPGCLGDGLHDRGATGRGARHHPGAVPLGGRCLRGIPPQRAAAGAGAVLVLRHA
ncbi:hypothetical protein G6F32_014333 [Rhizopus arrhizus]|nr:hypothetical protein G6F32_014333 [Rhizopus arrhizus]